jgi:SAM-dependent methyltransferase
MKTLVICSRAIERDEHMKKIAGFPRKFLQLLRCVRDGGQLSVCQEVHGDDVGICDGNLRCVKCSHEYPIENGIVRLMTETLTQETEHEIVLKDQEYEAMPDTFVPPSSGWRSEFADQIEIPPHLDAIKPLDGRRVLELACGDGRFTLLMAQLGAEVLAIDFCVEALRKLSSNLVSGIAPTSYKVSPQLPAGSLVGRVGLVQADASNLQVAPRSFDRALSASPLDSRDERMKMYRSIAEALTDDGRYVGGVEYDDLYRRVFGMPLVRRYTPGGVLIEHLDIPGMRREAAPYFGRMRFRNIRAHVPFVKHRLAKRLPRLAVFLSLMVCALPVSRHLGELLLLTAERPRRLPVDGERRASIMGARQLYCWYKRRKGEEPMWDPGVPV